MKPRVQDLILHYSTKGDVDYLDKLYSGGNNLS